MNHITCVSLFNLLHILNNNSCMFLNILSNVVCKRMKQFARMCNDIYYNVVNRVSNKIFVIS